MVEKEMEERLYLLKEILKGMGRFVLAFSGGVDSSFLLAIAHRTIGEGVLPVTALSETFPGEDLERAKSLTRDLGIEHIQVRTGELSNPDFIKNPPDRCYHCKMHLFTQLFGIARERGFPHVADGTNASDQDDWRPGHSCGMEMGVRSPLKEAGIGKGDIRALSPLYGLADCQRPASPCLASRFPYGVPITAEGIRRVSHGERFLRSLGFREVRLRHHAEMARIEIPEGQMEMALSHREKIVEMMEGLGYIYTCIDLKGFRSGSLNEVLGRPLPEMGR